jgi:COP9 signalosome complex subunit 4
MDGALASAAAIADQRQKIEQYRLILASVLSSSPPDIAQAKRFLNHSNNDLCSNPILGFVGFYFGLLAWIGSAAVVSDEVPLVVSRQLLEPDSQKEVAHYALTQIQPRVVSFEEQVGTLRFLSA